MNKAVFFLATGLLAGVEAYASHACHSNDCTENAKVDYIESGRDGGFTVCFDKPVLTDSLYSGPMTFHCNSGPYCATADGTDPGAKSMLSVLLAAKATGTPVDFYVRDNQCIYPTGSAGWYQITVAIIDR